MLRLLPCKESIASHLTRGVRAEDEPRLFPDNSIEDYSNCGQPLGPPQLRLYPRGKCYWLEPLDWIIECSLRFRWPERTSPW